MKKSAIVNNILFAIGILAVGVMVANIGWQSILKNIEDTGWWFLAVLAVWLVVYVLNALSWRLIIRNNCEEAKRIPFLYILKLTITGYAINCSTPVGLMGGEPYRILELKKYVGATKATSSVILYSMMHVVSHFLLWMISVLLIAVTIPMDEGLIGTLVGVFTVCMALLVLFFKGYKKGMVVKVFTLLRKLPYVKKWAVKFYENNEEKLQIIDEQIAHLHGNQKRRFYSSLGLELLARVVGCLEIYFIVQAMGFDITFIDSVIVVAFSSLFANILFFSPMQLGTREGGYILALKLLALPANLGFSVSIITRIRELFWIALGMMIMKLQPDASSLPTLEETPLNVEENV
ncbi:MAG: lysylphosphatidylglycerol synthase transmembrane domain-containing protein [Tannerellaceae bacterium]